MSVHSRRCLLASIGGVSIVGLSGCLGEEPAHDSEDGLALTLSMMEESTDDKWVVPNEYKYDVDYEFHAVEDGTITTIIAGSIDVFDTIDKASERVKSAIEARDANQFDVGDEAYWYSRGDSAVIITRHSNAVTALFAVRRSNQQFLPATDRGIAVARTWTRKLEEKA